MPLSDREYTHPSDCACPRCRERRKDTSARLSSPLRRARADIKPTDNPGPDAPNLYVDMDGRRYLQDAESTGAISETAYSRTYKAPRRRGLRVCGSAAIALAWLIVGIVMFPFVSPFISEINLPIDPGTAWKEAQIVFRNWDFNNPLHLLAVWGIPLLGGV